MANKASLLVDPAGTYEIYTSNIYSCNSARNANDPQGVVQIEITSGNLILQGRMSEEAPWFDLKTYTTSTIEAFVMPYQVRAVSSSASKCWVGEVS